MYGIKNNLLDFVKKDYKDHLPQFDFSLDCSFGTNPWGSWPGLGEMGDLLQHIDGYPPEDGELKERIIQHFADAGKLTPEMISLTLGSIGGIMTLDRMFLYPGKPVIGVAPQFTAAVDDFRLYGADYSPVYLQGGNGYHLQVKDLIKAIDETEEAYVYLDNPNNPTGQVLSVADLERIAAHAKAKNSFVVLDEAYGDYLDIRESAAGLLSQFDNLAVIRSFSKGLGAAGIRLGYVMASPWLIKAFDLMNIPYSKSSLAGQIALRLINSGWEKECSPLVIQGKTMLLQSLQLLKAAQTSRNVPITMLYTEDTGIDLANLMERVGLKVVSCRDYEGLGQNCVRLNLNRDMAALIHLLGKTEALLKVVHE